jgi:uncharacterized C2H2 Zn-finger protein
MIRCLNCGQTFDALSAYQRHQWSAHAGEPDHGEQYR